MTSSVRDSDDALVSALFRSLTCSIDDAIRKKTSVACVDDRDVYRIYVDTAATAHAAPLRSGVGARQPVATGRGAAGRRATGVHIPPELAQILYQKCTWTLPRPA